MQDIFPCPKRILQQVSVKHIYLHCSWLEPSHTDCCFWTLTPLFPLHIQVKLRCYQKNMQNHGCVNIKLLMWIASSSELFIDFLFFWQDYSHDYPVTLPLRRPYSGNPGILIVFSRNFKRFSSTDPYTLPTSLTQKFWMRKNLENLLPAGLKMLNYLQQKSLD